MATDMIADLRLEAVQSPMHGLLHVAADEDADGGGCLRPRRVLHLEVGFDLGVDALYGTPG